MSFKYFQETCSDYEKLLENETGYDVIIYAGEDENVKEIHAHSLILCARSQYFCRAFSNEWVKKKNEKFIFKKPNISPQLFKIILRFIYCGEIDLTKLQVSEMLKLLIAVDELYIQTLISCIQEYIIKNQDEYLRQNPIEILQAVCQYEPFIDLRNCCLQNIKTIFNSDKFINLESHLLEFLLTRDDLNLDEIEIWNTLIKWGLKQEPTLKKTITKWNQDDTSTFDRIFCRFIPLIRFHGISHEDYFKKVKPYEKVLSKELQVKSSNFQPRIFLDSTLINQKHITLFSKWINSNVSYYKLDLLYRASRDGNTAAEFHAKCDNKGPTIVIAKITNSEQIIGGYNPLEWDSCICWKTTNASFIFSLTNRNDLGTAKVGYNKDNECSSIYCSKTYGPTFGLGHDLSLQYNNTDNSVSFNSRYSPKIDIPSNHKLGVYNALNVEDYEVFQVKRVV